MTMIRRTRAPALILLVALVLLVGVPPSLNALDRLPSTSTTVAGEEPGSQSTPQMVANDGDPDDWATSTESEDNAGGAIQGGTGGDGSDWRDYLESIRDLILRIKNELGGIL